HVDVRAESAVDVVPLLALGGAAVGFPPATAIASDVATLLGGPDDQSEGLKANAAKELLAVALDGGGGHLTRFGIEAVVTHEAGQLDVVRAANVDNGQGVCAGEQLTGGALVGYGLP